MDFTIVTPSFRQLEQLGCCIASIADQEGVGVEHIVQDGGTRGFEDFAKKMAARWPDRPGYRRVMVSEPDGGMYDAINRGLEKATGRICAYLNCDEQYLPGVLETVLQRFQNSPKTDLFLGDVLVVGLDGGPICIRKMTRPGLAHTWTCHFGALTAGIFFRHSILKKGIFFDTSYRAVADAEWFSRILQAGAEVGTLGFPTSTFMEAGTNLGLSSVALAERAQLTQTAPPWMRVLRPWWVIWHRIRRLLAGAHLPSQISYQIHSPERDGRKEFHAKKLRTTWPGASFGTKGSCTNGSCGGI
ncbi:MAG: glycosyltransferase [Verrucomicrobia bacterium]|nr:glycosyltransferase [Verrucomicrobiota bacterium]